VGDDTYRRVAEADLAAPVTRVGELERWRAEHERRHGEAHDGP